MPYTLKPNKLFVKDPNGNGYLPQNVVTDRATSDVVADITAAGTTQTTRVNSAGATQITAIGNKAAELDSKLDEADEAISKIDSLDDIIAGLRDLLDLVHPVGSIYISLDSTNPGTMFGGTWELIPGRFLLGVGAPANNSNVFWGEDLTYDGTNKYGESAGVTGGTSRTQLNEGNLPEHAHRAVGKPGESNDWVFPILKNVPNYTGAWTFSRVEGGGDNYVVFASHAVDGHGYTDVNETAYTGATGNGTPCYNMPPYFTVYMWKRTA